MAIGLVNCKKTHCPGFPGQLIDYIPYVEGDIIRFRNEANDTLSIKVKENWVTNEYSFSWNCKCSCGAGASFSTELDTLSSIKIVGSISCSKHSAYLNLDIYDYVKTIDEFSRFIENADPYLEENNNIFGDTIFNHYEQFNRFNDLTIVKGEGIIQFWDEKLNCLWSKID